MACYCLWFGLGCASVSFTVQVLLVEDDLDSRGIYRLMLEALGFSVIGAANGKDAIGAAIDANPDLILIDLDPPEVDGLVTVGAIRAIITLGGLPIIAMTAHPLTFTIENAMRAGCNDYLRKPLTTNNLSLALSRFSGGLRIGTSPQRRA